MGKRKKKKEKIKGLAKIAGVIGLIGAIVYGCYQLEKRITRDYRPTKEPATQPYRIPYGWGVDRI